MSELYVWHCFVIVSQNTGCIWSPSLIGSWFVGAEGSSEVAHAKHGAGGFLLRLYQRLLFEQGTPADSDSQELSPSQHFSSLI